MSEKHKKMIAPIVVTILFMIYFAFYFLEIVQVTDGITRLLLGLIPIFLASTLLYVCIDRIKEIRSGEEDDLSKY